MTGIIRILRNIWDEYEVPAGINSGGSVEIYHTDDLDDAISTGFKNYPSAVGYVVRPGTHESVSASPIVGAGRIHNGIVEAFDIPKTTER